MLVAWNTSPKDRCQLSSLQDAQEYQLRSSYSLKYCGDDGKLGDAMWLFSVVDDGLE